MIKNYVLFQTAMEMMGTVGVIVNCALIGLSGQVNRMFPNITATQTILLIIVLEVHIIPLNPTKQTKLRLNEIAQSLISLEYFSSHTERLLFRR